MRIYTRGGDRGKTSLIGGKRRYKDDVQVHAYGAVDEAGAFVGLATTHLEKEGYADMVAVLGACPTITIPSQHDSKREGMLVPSPRHSG